MKKLFTAFVFSIFLIPATRAQITVNVIDTSFKLPILGEELLFFGFAEGDQIVFNFSEQNGKDLKEIEVTEFPSTSRFKENKTSSIQNKTLTVPRTGVYQFRFANTVMLQKTCNLKIQRIAASDATRNFNTTVFWRIAYDTIYRNFQPQTKPESYKTAVLLPPNSYYLEASTADSKRQISLPVPLPDFTAEWYYAFATTNNKEKAEALKSSLQLNSTLLKKITETGGLSFSADSLSTASGSANCRIYLLDQMNHELFDARSNFRHFKEGTKENTPAGLVKIKTANFPNAYLGIRNPNPEEGIYVVIEAVAVIAPDDTAQMAGQQTISVRARKEPYLKN
jgi:hypothetical protein